MNKILPALVAVLLATTATVATAQEESWPGSPTMVGPGPLAPGGVVGEYDDDDDDTTVQIEDDDGDDDDGEEEM